MSIAKSSDEKSRKQNNRTIHDKKNKTVKNTSQKTIPYNAIFENGMIQLSQTTYSMIYELVDIDFQSIGEYEQSMLFEHFGELLNVLSDAKIEICCINRNIDTEEFTKKYLIKMREDGLNIYRKEVNDIMMGNLQESNGLENKKYLTLTINADTPESAARQFEFFAGTVSNAVNSIGGSSAIDLSPSELLKVLYNCYQPFNNDVIDIDTESLTRQGLSTKDIIAPSVIKILNNVIELNDEYATVLFVSGLPTSLTTDFISELNSIPCVKTTAIHFDSISQEKSMKLVRRQLLNINTNIANAQKKAYNSGYSQSMIPPTLAFAKEEAETLLNDITKRNQKLFYMTMVTTVYAENKESLAQCVQLVQAVGKKYMMPFKKLNYQQEAGFNASLPIGLNALEIKHLVTTEVASLFIPYSSEVFAHTNGLYYGINQITKSSIIFDRLQSKNANGVITGTPGSGKSFAAKREMLSVLLGTESDVYVIDPEGEYTSLAEMLGGEVIKIAVGSDTYINPLDMDMRYGDEKDPVTLKADFMCAICETAMGERYALSPIQKSIIDRCVREVYVDYISYMHGHPELSSSIEHSPTLVDFYERLLAQPEPEASSLALALEMFCTGSMNIFAHRTNINTKKRFIVYNIKDIGSNLKELGLHVCLNDIWNKTIANKALNKRTWFYIDEFYLLTQTPSSATYLQQIFKRARKWGGVPTGITQNVEDLLSNQEARSILNNCDFIMMLNQSPLDRAQLSEMFNISPEQQKYITNSKAGSGLLYTGHSLVPFLDKYPRNTKSFMAMTTNVNDIKT